MNPGISPSNTPGATPSTNPPISSDLPERNISSSADLFDPAFVASRTSLSSQRHLTVPSDLPTFSRHATVNNNNHSVETSSPNLPPAHSHSAADSPNVLPAHQQAKSFDGHYLRPLVPSHHHRTAFGPNLSGESGPSSGPGTTEGMTQHTRTSSVSAARSERSESPERKGRGEYQFSRVLATAYTPSWSRVEFEADGIPGSRSTFTTR